MLSTSVLLAKANIIWRLKPYGVEFHPFWTPVIEILKYLQEKKNEEHSPSLDTHSTDNKAVVNYLSTVRVELIFFRFFRIFLPPYLLPVHILMPQYVLLIKWLHLYFLLRTPES